MTKTRHFIAGLLALAAACAQAGVGLTELPGQKGDGPVTVFYPSSAPDQPTTRGPFTLELAPQGPAVRGNGRLVVMSHGSGGSPWVHSNLARALVEAGYVVAMPRHHGDNSSDPSSPGPDSWKIRPAEVSRAIDAVAADARFAPLVDFSKVGMYGMSAGGHTALSLAGGRWSPASFRKHCEANLEQDFATCVGLATRLNGGMLDGLKKTVALGVIRRRFDDDSWQTHTDPRIKAIVAGVPAAADFDMASLAQPAVPLALVTAGQDKWLVPRFHSSRVLASCKTCEHLADLPDGGHGFLLSPPVPPQLLGDLAGSLLNDPPGFDRSVLPAIDRKIAAFFSKHLLP
jgi:predicted dienelactone hydrolase